VFLNRWLYRHELIEQNQLDSQEQVAVFAVLKPFQVEGGEERFLESEADSVIGLVRSGRPHGIRSLSVEAEDVQVNDQESSHRNAWAVSVDRTCEKPFRKSPTLLLVDEEQAAQMLGVSRRTIFDLNKQGTLPSVMVGSRKKYSVKMLRAFADGEVV
jgi:excisionase family DNA binding protein